MSNVFRTDVLSGFNCANIVADWTGLCLDEMTDVELVDLAIEKWQMVRKTFDALPDGTEVRDVGVRTCALCQVYYDDGDCTRCPILAYTGCPQCRETPYLEWAGETVSCECRRRDRILGGTQGILGTTERRER